MSRPLKKPPIFDKHKHAIRFLSKVSIDSDTGCWVWSAAKTRGGYGNFPVKRHGWNMKMERAHRVSYEIFISTHYHIIRHKCDNPPCVNPAHLEDGTLADNSYDTVSRGRQARGDQVQHPGNNNLTPELVKYIRDRYKLLTQPELSELLGISRAQVCRIVNNTTWRWL